MRMLRFLAAMLAAGLLTAAMALPAAAGTRVTSVSGSYLPSSVLKLTVNDGQKYDPYTARSVVLTCDPAGGTHPDPKTACKLLAQVDGNFPKLNVHPEWLCPLIFDPVTVTAKGSWKGRDVKYQETFGNSCELERKTGEVFKF